MGVNLLVEVAVYFKVYIAKTVAALGIAFSLSNAALAAREPTLVEAFPGLEFNRPIDLQSTPAFSDRVFIVEQDGAIYSAVGTSKNLVVDLSSLVSRDGGERGLLGMAFHPGAATNGYFFVNYTRKSDGATVIARFTMNLTTVTADIGSEAIFMTVAQPFSNHNAGSLAFGADGFLYIPLGDGGSGGDPQGNGQNPAAFLGKILRIDVDRSDGSSLYSIPVSNPFANGQKGFAREIYAYGFRNPFKISFDSKTRRLWVGDVGQSKQEEVDIVKRGKNYGWNRMEGNLCYPSGKRCALRGLVPPVWVYGRSLGQSITGGYVYRGPAVRALQGQYVYADFVSGRIWRLSHTSQSTRNKLIADTDLNISSFGVDQNKELYIVSYDGRIFKFAA